LAKQKRFPSFKLVDNMDVFSGTLEDAAVLNNEYSLFVLGTEKFQTTTYLRELVYGKKATSGRIQRFYSSSK